MNMRIRKFNEDLESERLDLEFVKECFIELIDKYNAKIEPCEFGEDEKRGCAISININVNNDITQYYTNCYSLDSVKKLSETFSYLVDISDYAVGMIKGKYSDIESAFDFVKTEGEDDRYYFLVDLYK